MQHDLAYCHLNRRDQLQVLMIECSLSESLNNMLQSSKMIKENVEIS